LIRPVKQSGEAPPTWLWIIALIAIAAFAALVMYLDYHQKRDGVAQIRPDAKSTKERASGGGHSAKGKKLPGDGKEFDFYQLLPDIESIVGENETDKVKSAPPTKAASKPSQNNSAQSPDKPKLDRKPLPALVPPNGGMASQHSESLEYYLQVGAYKQFQAADRMKANLAMLGLKASIQRVDIGTVGRVHRVRLGPYANIRDMRRIQTKLKSGNIPSIMVRSKLP